MATAEQSDDVERAFLSLKTQIATMQAGLETQLATMKADLKTQIATMQADLETQAARSEARLIRWIVGSVAGGVAVMSAMLVLREVVR